MRKDWKTLKWRKKAHKALDKLWKEWGFSRRDAYKILQNLMGRNGREAHISMFTIDECKTLVERINRQLEEAKIEDSVTN